jgi:hypothetical protein
MSEAGKLTEAVTVHLTLGQMARLRTVAARTGLKPGQAARGLLQRYLETCA